MSEEILNRITRIKRMLKDLLEKGDLDYALEIVRQYEKVVLNDVEILSFKGVIYYAKNELDKAEEIFKEALLIDSTYFDLYFNLGCLFETKNDYKKAVRYFNRASEFSNSEEEKKEILRKIEYYKQITDIPTEKKIAFFIRKGLDNFIDDIILGLMDDYFVRKIIVTDFKQIDEGMQWADICWFEWCDELVIYGSRHELARERKMICRIHGYEVYTSYIEQPNYVQIDKIIFVADHIKKIFEEKVNIEDKKKLVIHCGINVNKFPLKIRKKGYNIGYLGYINFKKNIPLTLHIFKELYNIDKRYKLHIAGQFQDERTKRFFEYFIKENKLEDNVVFYGWLNNKEKIKWFDNIDYMLISSIDEGLCFAAAEAMLCGIKPVLHNCEGIKEHYIENFIFNSVYEAVKMILSEDYDSAEYRVFIEKNYSFEKELFKIQKLLESVLNEQNPIKTQFLTNIYFENKEYRFYIPNLSDYIQKIIYKTSRFYEEEMLRDIKQRIKEGSIIFDIGANIGNHTVFMASLKEVKKIISIEPYEYNFRILLKNIELNNLNEKVIPLQMALGDSFGKGKLIIEDKNNLGGCKIEKDKTGDITLETLDRIVEALNLDRVDLVKIDVEGMELEVLKGSIQSLHYYKPILYVEIFNENFSRVNSFLNDLGYKAIKVFNATPTYIYINE